MKLDVGGGFNINVCFPEEESRQDFIVVDKYNLNHPDVIRATAWNIPLANESVKSIFSSHMLEHMPFERVIPTLAEWYRLLEIDGTLYLHIPDLEYCVKTWLDTPEDHPQKWNWFIKIIFGGQEYEGDSHCTGFTQTRINNLLSNLKFNIFHTEKLWCDVHNQMEIRSYCKKNETN